MTLEPARIHGRTFLQKALCREIFHRDDSNNSVFSVNYNFSGGNICGGGFFGGVLGGLAYGAGAALMGKTLSWLNGGSSGSAFGFPALTMPTFGFPSFGFPSFSQFSSFGGFTPFSSQISSFWGGGAGNSSSTLGSTTSTAAPASTTSSAKVKDTPKDKEEKKTDKAKIKELKAKYKELKNSKDRGEAFQQDLTKLYNDLRAIQNPNWRVRRLIKNVEKLAAENNLNIIQQAKEKTEPVKEEALTIAESVQKAQSMDDLLVILDNNEYDKLIETDKKSFNEKFDKYLNNMKLKDVEDSVKEENLPNELKNKAVVKKDVLSNNDDEIKEQLSPQLQEIEYPAPTEEKDKAKAQPQQPGQPDAASPVAKKDDKAAAVKPADEQDETEEPEELEEPAQPEVKVKPDKEPEDKIAAAATQKQTEAANAKQEVEDAFGKVKLNDKGKTLLSANLADLNELNKDGKPINVIDTDEKIPDFLNRVVIKNENNTITIAAAYGVEISYKYSGKTDERTGAKIFISDKDKQEYVLQKDEKGNYYLMQYSWMKGYGEGDLTEKTKNNHDFGL